MTVSATKDSARAPALLDSRQLFIGAVFSLVFVILALRDVQVSDVARALARVNPLWLTVALASFVITTLAKAARWRVLFALQRSPSLGRSFSILSIGVLLNSFAPARLGDLARAYLIGESEASSKVYALGTIAIEKVADLVFLMLSVSLLLSQMALPDWLGGPARATAASILILLPLVLFLAWTRGLVLRAMEYAGRWLPSNWGEWLVQRARLGLESLQVLRTPRLLITLIAWSALICLLGASTNYLVFGTLGMDLNPWAALLLLVVLQVGVAVPSSPGRIGVFHYLTILTLSVFSIDKETALGYSVVLYLVVYAPIALIGAYCLWSQKVTWQKLIRVGRSLPLKSNTTESSEKMP